MNAAPSSFTLATAPVIETLLGQGAPVAISISGGKDSSAVALATNAYLDQFGHQGPRVLIHADLGRIEWHASQEMCEKVARVTGLELLVVRREAGDMIERWTQRWASSVRRYTALECVKLIMPWSAPALRFCTSEMKTQLIGRMLVRRFPHATIISVSGIRAQESPSRSKVPVAAPAGHLLSISHHTTGYDWRPLLQWTKDEVLAFHAQTGFPLHEAYTTYGASRVSCAFCIMSSQADLAAAASAEQNAEAYRALCDLEIESTFPFQQDKWLFDVAPYLLTPFQHSVRDLTRERKERREGWEAQIPKHLLYTRGWPTCMPTMEEAALLARVRIGVQAEVSRLGNALPRLYYFHAATIRERYAGLLRAKEAKT